MIRSGSRFDAITLDSSSLTVVGKVLEGDVLDVARPAARDRMRVVGPAKDLDPRAVLGVGHGDIADEDVGDNVGCSDISVGR
jgi:hypothetical protein